jgi:hypothetical protein
MTELRILIAEYSHTKQSKPEIFLRNLHPGGCGLRAKMLASVLTRFLLPFSVKEIR